MKLSKLYSNKPEVFTPILFNPGLNVVLAEIRLPENKHKDTHNLGKSTLGSLLNFCLLSGRNKELFPFSNEDILKDFIFYLEIELSKSSYITIKRSVAEPGKISLLRSKNKVADVSLLAQKNCSHLDISLEAAKDLLNGWLDWNAIKPKSYRQLINYLLRPQNGYQSPFRPLVSFHQKSVDWKPFVCQILGLDASLIEHKYQLQEKEIQIKDEIKSLPEDSEYKEDISKVEGLKSVLEEDIKELKISASEINFAKAGQDTAELLVRQTENELSRLNNKLYKLNMDINEIELSVKKDNFLFDPEKAAELFKDAGIIFPHQLKRTYEDLIKFNQEITQERKGYLERQKKELLEEKSKVINKISILNQERSERLDFLKDMDVFRKFKTVSEQIASKQNKLEELNRIIEEIKNKTRAKNRLEEIKHETSENQSKISNNIAEQSGKKNTLFYNIRTIFFKIIEKVLDRKALIYALSGADAEGGLEFRAELISKDGVNTDEAKGHSYNKILCVAFDLALIISHLQENFPRFVFHDGAFEGLDDWKKENLKAVIENFCDEGIQYIVTTLDSDLPYSATKNFFKDEDIVVKLHDEGTSGRLFHMPSW